LVCSVVPKLPVEDGINAIRRVLPRCWFELGTTDEGVKALRQYGREWDDIRKVFIARPLHDWTSHPTDAFRYLSIGLSDLISTNRHRNVPQRDMAWVV
jgi:phage terminase large subunit